jgi:hypothetical protein
VHLNGSKPCDRIKEHPLACMQPHARRCVGALTVLGYLAGLSAAHAAQTCTQKFSGLRTCTLFNDQFATGNAASLEATRVIDGKLLAGYANTTSIQKTFQCQILYVLFGCINAVSHPQVPAAAPCSSAGTRLQMCKGLCVKYHFTSLNSTLWNLSLFISF